MGGELEDGVERQMLQSAHAVQLLCPDLGHHLVGSPDVAAVPVVERHPEQCPVGVQESVVHGPCIDADRGDGTAARRHPETVQHALVQGEHVPPEPVGQPDRGVGEAVRLGQHQLVGTDPAGDHPAAGGTEVDRGEHRVVS